MRSDANRLGRCRKCSVIVMTAVSFVGAAAPAAAEQVVQPPPAEHDAAGPRSGAATPAPQAASAAAPAIPGYQTLRFNEDYRVIEQSPAAGDYTAPIKHISLSDDDSLWVSFGGQARVRIEGWNNFNFGAPAGADDDNVFALTRVLFHADLHVGEHLRFFFEGKSALAIDRDLVGGRRTIDTDEIDLQNGFADLALPLPGVENGRFTFRAGRHELLFGKQRLVSPLDWVNTRRTFDGFSGIFKAGDWSITGFWSQLVEVRKYEFNRGDNHTALFGVYAAGKVPATDVGLDLYWLGLDIDDAAPASKWNGTTGDEDRHTLGGRLYGKLGDCGFDYDLEGAYQLGQVGRGDIDAFMVATQLGYTPANTPTNPRVFLGFDYASGDRSPGGDVQTFNQLFPLGHAYFGWIDQIGRQNIIDLSAGVTLKPVARLTVDLHGHLFWRAETQDGLYNAAGVRYRAPGSPGSRTSREVGQEIDLLLRYQCDRHTEIQFGYSHFFAGPFIEQTGPRSDIDFVYVAVQYTF